MTEKKQKKALPPITKDAALDSIFDRMSETYHIKKESIPAILRDTAFKADKASDPVASDAEMISLLSVAEKYNLNPFIREIYAFRNKKGVLIPVVGVDGWIKILNNGQGYEGFELSYSDNMIEIGKSKECFEWIEISIHITDRKYPVIVREYLDECYNGGKFDHAPWDTHTKRMLRHKVISQGTRVAYGVNDVCDPDEADRIDQTVTELIQPDTAGDLPTDDSEIIPPIDETIPPVDEAPAVETAEAEQINLLPETTDEPPPVEDKIETPPVKEEKDIPDFF